MLGQGGSGFSLAFENKEVTVDAELAAIKRWMVSSQASRKS